MSYPAASNLAAVAVPVGDFAGYSFAYTNAGGSIWEYNTTPVRLGNIPPNSIQGTLVISGVQSNPQIAACWALTTNSQSTLHVFYINKDGFLANVYKELHAGGPWNSGVLSSNGWGAGNGKGLQYAIANNSLLRIGFWGNDGSLYEAICDAGKYGSVGAWSLIKLLNTALQ